MDFNYLINVVLVVIDSDFTTTVAPTTEYVSTTVEEPSTTRWTTELPTTEPGELEREFVHMMCGILETINKTIIFYYASETRTAPLYDVIVKGYFESSNGEDFSQECISSHSSNFYESAQNTVPRINAALGETLCVFLPADAFSIVSFSTLLYGLDNTVSIFSSLRYFLTINGVYICMCNYIGYAYVNLYAYVNRCIIIYHIIIYLFIMFLGVYRRYIQTTRGSLCEAR